MRSVLKMMYGIIAALLLSALSVAAYGQENMMDCEIIVEVQGVKPAKFMPANDFIFSVFTGKTLKDIKGDPVRALLCKRSNVIPSEFDIKFVKTNIPLYLSPDFDAPQSALLSVFKQDGKYAAKYIGPGLSAEKEVDLNLWLNNLNQ